MLQIKRVYESPGKKDGVRILVDRLWPRGIRKDELVMDEWRKDIAPSPELRKWFSHQTSRWEEFSERYQNELNAHPEVWGPVAETARKKNVTLLYAARDSEHNHAIVLLDFLQKKSEE